MKDKGEIEESLEASNQNVSFQVEELGVCGQFQQQTPFQECMMQTFRMPKLLPEPHSQSEIVKKRI